MGVLAIALGTIATLAGLIYCTQRVVGAARRGPAVFVIPFSGPATRLQMETSRPHFGVPFLSPVRMSVCRLTGTANKRVLGNDLQLLPTYCGHLSILSRRLHRGEIARKWAPPPRGPPQSALAQGAEACVQKSEGIQLRRYERFQDDAASSASLPMEPAPGPAPASPQSSSHSPVPYEGADRITAPKHSIEVLSAPLHRAGVSVSCVGL